MSQAKSKTKKLWQIFFDEDTNYDEEAATSDVRRVMSSVKRKVTRKVNKSAPSTSGRHGVIYDGLMESDASDSDDELNQGRSGEGAKYDPNDPPDLDLGRGSGEARETVLFDKSPRSQNGINGKPYDAREWEAVTLDDPSRRPARQALPRNGARFIIRSESDLELAVAVGKRPRRCCVCCTPECVTKYSDNYICIVLVGVVLVAAYVAIVLAIVYGLK